MSYITESNRNRILENKRLYPKESEFKIGSLIENCLYSFPNYPDGLVRTSVRELSLYLSAMMNKGALNGKKILKKETVDKMLSLQLKDKLFSGIMLAYIEIRFFIGRY